MPVRSFQLLGFEDLRLVQPGFLEDGTLYWLLREHAPELFPAWLFAGWRGESRRGRPAWPAPLLMGVLLLRYSQAGMSRARAVERVGNDAKWRAALRLPWGASPPSERSVRDFEAFMKADHPECRLPRIVVFFEHVTRLFLEVDGSMGEMVPVIDSTPMWCYGAVLDTVNLLGEGLRALGRRWATARRMSIRRVAQEWGLPLLRAKSTKGFFEGTDWSDVEARSVVLTELADAINRVVALVTSRLDKVPENRRAELSQRCEVLLKIVSEDLEADEAGALHVVRRKTSERLISLTDPEAQHFRKSASQVFAGFKLHVLGDAISGLILSLSVTPGGAHDQTQAHPLIARAKALREDIEEVLGDAAYGGMSTRREVLEGLGVRILAPPAPAGSKDKLGKKDFDIDFERMRATCPGGVETTTWKHTQSNGEAVPTFCWEKGSEDACTCRDRCPAHRTTQTKTGEVRGPRRRLRLHPDEQELRRHRADWADPEIRRRYRKRSQGERLIRQMTRRGARYAAGWGLATAELQAYCIAAVNNLALLARALAAHASQARAA